MRTKKKRTKNRWERGEGRAQDGSHIRTQKYDAKSFSVLTDASNDIKHVYWIEIEEQSLAKWFLFRLMPEPIQFVQTNAQSNKSHLNFIIEFFLLFFLFVPVYIWTFWVVWRTYETAFQITSVRLTESYSQETYFVLCAIFFHSNCCFAQYTHFRYMLITK